LRHFIKPIMRVWWLKLILQCRRCGWRRGSERHLELFGRRCLRFTRLPCSRLPVLRPLWYSSGFRRPWVNSSALGRASEVRLLPAQSPPSGDFVAPRISSHEQWSC
jgi:hypothetical protein